MGLVWGIRYWLRLIREIMGSIIDVSKRCFNGDIDPCLVTIDTDVKQPLSQVFLTSSITYTPGTVTIDIDSKERKILVGSINPRGRGDIIPMEPHVLGWLGE
jgi:energy-converting hydrogenase B subunit A